MVEIFSSLQLNPLLMQDLLAIPQKSDSDGGYDLSFVGFQEGGDQNMKKRTTRDAGFKACFAFEPLKDERTAPRMAAG